MAAESLDITPYVDLFAGGPKPDAPAPAPSSIPPAGPSTEPAAIHLPVDLLTLDASVGKFYFREIAAENFLAAVKVTESRVEVQPLQLALNGAPIKGGAKLNLGVPGYEYDVTVRADRVPVKPLANSFSPMLKDRIEGNIDAQLDVKGAGHHRRELAAAPDGRAPARGHQRQPELATQGNQKAGVLTLPPSVLATTLNIRELKEQPIMDILTTAKFGGGRNRPDRGPGAQRVAGGRLRREHSDRRGTDAVAPEFSPSTSRCSATSRNAPHMVPSNTPTNAAYVALPAIASVKGTLGAPAPEVDRVQAGILLARGVAGLLGGQGGAAVGGIADLVGGVAKGGTNSVGNLIQASATCSGVRRVPAPARAPRPLPPRERRNPRRHLPPLDSGSGRRPAVVAGTAKCAPASVTAPPAARTTNAPAAAPATNRPATKPATTATNPAPAKAATNSAPVKK